MTFTRAADWRLKSACGPTGSSMFRGQRMYYGANRRARKTSARKRGSLRGRRFVHGGSKNLRYLVGLRLGLGLLRRRRSLLWISTEYRNSSSYFSYLFFFCLPILGYDQYYCSSMDQKIYTIYNLFYFAFALSVLGRCSCISNFEYCMRS